MAKRKRKRRNAGAHRAKMPADPAARAAAGFQLGGPKTSRAAFLASYATVGSITSAAAACGMDRVNHYRWLSDPDYAAAFRLAHAQACESLEAEARRRAVEGVLEPVYQGGVMVGGVRKYSDTLLIFLMKGAMPEKYKERYQFDIPALDSAIERELARLAAGS